MCWGTAGVFTLFHARDSWTADSFEVFHREQHALGGVGHCEFYVKYFKGLAPQRVILANFNGRAARNSMV